MATNAKRRIRPRHYAGSGQGAQELRTQLRKRGRRPGQNAALQRFVLGALRIKPRAICDLVRDTKKSAQAIYKVAVKLKRRGLIVELRRESRPNVNQRVAIYGPRPEEPQPARWRFIPAGL